MTKIFSYCTNVDSINDHHSSGGMNFIIINSLCPACLESYFDKWKIINLEDVTRYWTGYREPKDRIPYVNDQNTWDSNMDFTLAEYVALLKSVRYLHTLNTFLCLVVADLGSPEYHATPYKEWLRKYAGLCDECVKKWVQVPDCIICGNECKTMANPYGYFENSFEQIMNIVIAEKRKEDLITFPDSLDYVKCVNEITVDEILVLIELESLELETNIYEILEQVQELNPVRRAEEYKAFLNSLFVNPADRDKKIEIYQEWEIRMEKMDPVEHIEELNIFLRSLMLNLVGQKKLDSYIEKWNQWLKEELKLYNLGRVGYLGMYQLPDYARKSPQELCENQ